MFPKLLGSQNPILWGKSWTHGRRWGGVQGHAAQQQQSWGWWFSARAPGGDVGCMGETGPPPEPVGALMGGQGRCTLSRLWRLQPSLPLTKWGAGSYALREGDPHLLSHTSQPQTHSLVSQFSF